MGTNGRVTAALLAVGLYVASLALPAYRSPLRGSEVVYPGYDAFLTGWRAWVVPAPLDWDVDRAVLCAGWVANAAFGGAVLCLAGGSRRLAAGFAGLALAGQLPAAWRYWALVADCPGFWCWVAGPLWLVVAACSAWGRRPPSPDCPGATCGGQNETGGPSRRPPASPPGPLR